MTKQESENLAVAMNDINTIKDDIKEIKNILKGEDNRFLTRQEARAAGWVIGIALTALGIWVNLTR
jgi:hypothetical protein